MEQQREPDRGEQGEKASDKEKEKERKREREEVRKRKREVGDTHGGDSERKGGDERGEKRR